MKKEKVQIIENLPFNEYLAIDRLSCSSLKNFMDCPAYYKFRKETPMKETAAMALGTMIHTWLLESPRFNHEYYPHPKVKRNTKIGKETYAMYEEEAGERIMFDEELVQRYTKMTPMTDTINEITVLFEIDGMPCKSRFDALHGKRYGTTIIPTGVEDVKTIANIQKLDKDFAGFKYYLQAGFYSIAYHEAFGTWPEFFKFRFVNTGEFPATVVREIAWDYMEHGRVKTVDMIEELKECLKTDVWPGLYDGPIERPSWI